MLVFFCVVVCCLFFIFFVWVLLNQYSCLLILCNDFYCFFVWVVYWICIVVWKFCVMFFVVLLWCFFCVVLWCFFVLNGCDCLFFYVVFLLFCLGDLLNLYSCLVILCNVFCFFIGVLLLNLYNCLKVLCNVFCFVCWFVK